MSGQETLYLIISHKKEVKLPISIYLMTLISLAQNGQYLTTL